MKHYATSVGRSVSPCSGGGLSYSRSKISQILKGRISAILNGNYTIMSMKFVGNRYGKSIGNGILGKFPRIRKLEFPNFKPLYLPSYWSDLGVQICKWTRRKRTFLWNWKFPDRNNFLKILNGHNFVVLRDSIVVFVLVFIGKTRAFHWKWNFPPRTSHKRDRLPVPKVAPNIVMWPIVGRGRVHLGLTEKVLSGLEKPFWRNLAKCQFLHISEFQMAISQPFMNRIWSCLYSNCAEFQGLSNERDRSWYDLV